MTEPTSEIYVTFTNVNRKLFYLLEAIRLIREECDADREIIDEILQQAYEKIEDPRYP